MTEDPPAPPKMVPAPRPPLKISDKFDNLTRVDVVRFPTCSQLQGYCRPCTCAHGCSQGGTCKHNMHSRKKVGSWDPGRFSAQIRKVAAKSGKFRQIRKVPS